MDLRSSRQTRAKWSLPPQVEQVFPLAGHTFQGWAARRSPHQKHVPGSLRSFIWLCLKPVVQWTSSSIPFDDSAINLLVWVADSIALASATTSCKVFFELSGFMCVLSNSVLMRSSLRPKINLSLVSWFPVSTKAARLSNFDFPLLYGLIRGLG